MALKEKFSHKIWITILVGRFRIDFRHDSRCAGLYAGSVGIINANVFIAFTFCWILNLYSMTKAFYKEKFLQIKLMQMSKRPTEIMWKRVLDGNGTIPFSNWSTHIYIYIEHTRQHAFHAERWRWLTIRKRGKKNKTSLCKHSPWPNSQPIHPECGRCFNKRA